MSTTGGSAYSLTVIHLDNPINLRILRMMLKTRHIQHDVATNGWEAVQKWSGGGFHIILVRHEYECGDRFG